MKPQPSIILIEDDPDDIELFLLAIEELKVNCPIHTFVNAADGFSYLQRLNSAPGLILCDIRLSAESGLELRERIAADPRLHTMAIPFVFIGTTVSQREVDRAFELPVQGIFLKESSFEKYVDQLRRILLYWSSSLTPTSERPPVGWL